MLLYLMLTDIQNLLTIGIDNPTNSNETKQPGLTVELLRILTISNSNYEKVVLSGSKKQFDLAVAVGFAGIETVDAALVDFGYEGGANTSFLKL